MIWYTLTATVIKNRMPMVMATLLSFFLSTRMLVLPWYGEISSVVASRMIAVTASRG